VRLYIVPTLGSKRLDMLSVRDVRQWVNSLRVTCQCCAQRKDAARPTPRCCAADRCCQQISGPRTIRDAWTILRAALNTAYREELLTRNVAALIRSTPPTS
jgi:hypothetical protein